MPLAMPSVASRTRFRTSRPSVTGGRVHAESPEWMPASSMCLHDAADVQLVTVVERVDVDLDRVIENTGRPAAATPGPMMPMSLTRSK